MILKNWHLLLLYLYINITIASEQKNTSLSTDVKLGNIYLQKEKALSIQKEKILSEEIKEWANDHKSISFFTDDDEYQLNEITDVNEKINLLFNIIIANFTKSLDARIPVSNPQGLAFFKKDNVNTLKDDLNNIKKSLPVIQIKDIEVNFSKIQALYNTYIFSLQNPIPNILKNDLIYYYHALLHWAEEEKKIINEKMISDNITITDLIDKKWFALITLIKKNLNYIFNEKLALTIDQTNINALNKIKKNINDINAYTPKYQDIFNVIKQNYTNYEKIILIYKTKYAGLKSSNPLEISKGLQSLYKDIIKWEAEQKLNLFTREQDTIPTESDISNLISDLQLKIRTAYTNITKENKSLINWYNFPNYNHTYHAIHNLHPEDKSDFESAFNTLINAYDLHKKTVLSITQHYVDWAINNGLLVKNDVKNIESNAEYISLDNIVKRIQDALIKKIELLSIKYAAYPTLTKLKNDLPNQTTLSALSKAYIDYENEKVKIKNLYINWAINNGLLIKDEVKNANLDTIIKLIQQKLLKRINQLPLNQGNKQQIKNLLNTLSITTNLSKLSAVYTQYLGIKKNIPIPEVKNQPPFIQQKKPSNPIVPEKKSWWDWRSWLPSWPFKR